MRASAMKASRRPAAARAMPMTAGMRAMALRVPTMVRPMARPRSRMNQLAMTTMTAVSMTATAMARPTPQASQSCQTSSMKARESIMAARMATPAMMSSRAPRRSRMMPTAGVRIAPAMVPMVMAKPMEAVLQPNWSRRGGVSAPRTGLKKATEEKAAMETAMAIHQLGERRLKGGRRRMAGGAPVRSWGRVMGRSLLPDGGRMVDERRGGRRRICRRLRGREDGGAGRVRWRGRGDCWSMRDVAGGNSGGGGLEGGCFGGGAAVSFARRRQLDVLDDSLQRLAPCESRQIPQEKGGCLPTAAGWLVRGRCRGRGRGGEGGMRVL